METKRNRLFCCCDGGEEVKENEPTTVLGQYVEEPLIQPPVKRRDGQLSKRGISATLPLPSVREGSEDNELNRSEPAPVKQASSSVFSFHIIDSDDPPARNPAMSRDQGMGSFIQDLKKSPGHYVSSRSWNLSD